MTTYYVNYSCVVYKSNNTPSSGKSLFNYLNFDYVLLLGI